MKTDVSHYMNSIYLAHEGEGVHLGKPQVFVRYQGCAIGCLNCDSIDTWAFESGGRSMSTTGVLERIERAAFGVKRVSITGGDPLHPKHRDSILDLVKELKRRRYFVNIEASGMRIDHQIFDLIDFISFDFKTPSTGVRTPLKNLEQMMTHYPGKFQIKAVIESEHDFQAVLTAQKTVFKNLSIEESESFKICDWCLTPAFNLNESFPLERILNIQKWNNEQAQGFFRVIIQQHKVMHGPDKKQI